MKFGYSWFSWIVHEAILGLFFFGWFSWWIFLGEWVLLLQFSCLMDLFAGTSCEVDTICSLQVSYHLLSYYQAVSSRIRKQETLDRLNQLLWLFRKEPSPELLSRLYSQTTKVVQRHLHPCRATPLGGLAHDACLVSANRRYDMLSPPRAKNPITPNICNTIRTHAFRSQFMNRNGNIQE